MHIPGLAEAIARWFGGVHPSMRLSHEEMEVLRPIVSARKRPVTCWLLLIIVLGSAGLTLGLFELWSISRPVPQPPVLIDEPASLVWPGLVVSTFMFSLYVAGVMEPLLIMRRLGDWAKFYPAYHATVSNWLIHRQRVFLTLLMVPLSLFFLLFGWNFGLRVDSSTVTYGGSPLGRTTKLITEVSRVEDLSSTYTGGNANRRQWVRLTFKDGSVMQVETMSASVSGRTVAEFVAQRASVRVEPVRP